MSLSSKIISKNTDSERLSLIIAFVKKTLCSISINAINYVQVFIRHLGFVIAKHGVPIQDEDNRSALPCSKSHG